VDARQPTSGPEVLAGVDEPVRRFIAEGRVLGREAAPA
jgi:hypothetical protein